MAARLGEVGGEAFEVGSECMRLAFEHRELIVGIIGYSHLTFEILIEVDEFIGRSDVKLTDLLIIEIHSRRETFERSGVGVERSIKIVDGLIYITALGEEISESLRYRGRGIGGQLRVEDCEIDLIGEGCGLWEDRLHTGGVIAQEGGEGGKAFLNVIGVGESFKAAFDLGEFTLTRGEIIELGESEAEEIDILCGTSSLIASYLNLMDGLNIIVEKLLIFGAEGGIIGESVKDMESFGGVGYPDICMLGVNIDKTRGDGSESLEGDRLVVDKDSGTSGCADLSAHGYREAISVGRSIKVQDL